MAQYNEIKRFIALFEGSVIESDKKFYKQAKIPVSLYNDLDSYQIRLETVDSIAMHIPLHRVKDFNDWLNDQYFENYRLRKQHEVLEKAYSRYLMLAELLREPHD